MTDGFNPRLDIQSKPQRRSWDELAAVPPEFVLYGGTAIALHLGHRQSEGFDFFGSRSFDPEGLAASIAFLETATITHQEPNTLTALVRRGGPVKLSFFGLPRLPRLTPPHGGEGLSRYRCHPERWPDRSAHCSGECESNLRRPVQPTGHVESAMLFR